MVKHTLQDLMKAVITDSQLAGKIFEFHAANDRYGAAVSAAIAVPEAGRSYAEKNAVATARTCFNTERRNPTTNQILLETYLSEYSKDMNQRGWSGAKCKAAAIGLGGLVLLLASLGMDSKPAKLLAEAAGTAAAVGSPISLGIAYFKYRA